MGKYYFTGFADEAAADIDGQIKATKELGWSNIEARGVDGVQIHDVTDEKFDEIYGKLMDAGVNVNCFGSAIGNWSKKITDPIDVTIGEATRAAKRMERLGCKLIRVMSYVVCEGSLDDENQLYAERVKRLKEVVKICADSGVTVVHENCDSYGGMGVSFIERMINDVPGMRLVFDTGNPPMTHDRDKSEPYPMQNTWELYQALKQYIEYVHIKDMVLDEEKRPVFVMPGDGDGYVREVLTDLIRSGYSGGISMEPHLSIVVHDKSVVSTTEAAYSSYIEFSKRAIALVKEIEDEIK